MPMNVPTLPGLCWSEEVITRRQPLLTGVPVFLGFCSVPLPGIPPEEFFDQPRSLHLWPDFERKFGRHPPDSYVAAAVRGFFENGGRECVVLWFQRGVSPQTIHTVLSIENPLENVDLICAPDLVRLDETDREQWQTELLRYCAEMGDRFAILDIPDISTQPEVEVPSLGQSLSLASGSDYGALYGPWLKTTDGQTVPPCGHIAGMYATCDRAPIPQAPANIALAGVVDIAVASAEQSHQLAQTNNLVNGVRSLRGRGVRVWGARTLSRESQWRYVNVRRLAILIRRWINLNLAAVSFEPNDFRLWVRIERELNAFMQSLWQQGYLQGATASEAFRVRCDGETNPPEVRDRGQVITLIQFAPTTPNEFIQLRLIHGETGVGIAPP